MEVGELAQSLRREAVAVNERRLLALAGTRERTYDAATAALTGADIDFADTTYVSDRPFIDAERLSLEHASRLLGTTRAAVVVDLHDTLRPNLIGMVSGAVDGGGLLILCCPSLDDWPDQRDAFDERLAVPPASIEAVGDRFRRRVIDTLSHHPGIAIVDCDAGRIDRDGLTDPAPVYDQSAPTTPTAPVFPKTAYDACLTQDQIDCLSAFETLVDPEQALVVEADRGRGKSSVAGLAGACLAVRGNDVTVTAPAYRSTRAAFDRAIDLFDRLGKRIETTGAPPRSITLEDGGRIRYVPPVSVDPETADVLLVDEAAAIGVPLLDSYLAADRVAFTTTIHGYEGAGRGFSVRFRERLAASDHTITDLTMTEPIRYAAGDPVEVWAFHALLLDARPAVAPLVSAATPASATYRAVDQADLAADESLLREVFGLLVLAHYRTEPDDLARLLDAPNVSVRVLCQDGHVVSVALLAREGGLDAATRAAMYEGDRVRGNMLPDVLTSQLRDEAAAIPTGMRVMRIATHPAARSRGLGSALLSELGAEFADSVDWLGVGYGATPRLIEFWDDNGYDTVYLSTTRNDTSGEHSVLMLRPTSDAGVELTERHTAGFLDRIGPVLTDALDDVAPDIVRATLDATRRMPAVDLCDTDWRRIASMAYGPGLIETDPGPFRTLALAYLCDSTRDLLDDRDERLLVLKVLQARGWSHVVDRLEFPSRRACMQQVGEAFKPLVDTYGDAIAHEERDRFID
ncbi:MAG: tRNA(Met) cytidine acetyltransferase TmcA [Halobacteriales archaeon]